MPDSTRSSRAGSPRSSPARVLQVLYGVYAATLLTVLLLLAGLLALLVPVLAWRRATTRGFARLWLRAVGLLPHVSGLGQLPEGPCVLVANHSSYLDGLAIAATCTASL